VKWTDDRRKLAALCALNHVDVAPHHDCLFMHPWLPLHRPDGLSSRLPTWNTIHCWLNYSRTRHTLERVGW